MSDIFDNLRTHLDAARNERTATDAQLNDNAAHLSALERQLADVQRAGGDESTMADIRAAVEAARNERGSLLGTRRDINDRIRDRIGGIIVNLDPAVSFAALDASVPLALLPVRLETRFFNNSTELRIRIFPDQIHVDTHIPELTQSEADLGRWYWGQRLGGDVSVANAAWQALANKIGAERTVWVVRSLTPTNYDPASDGLAGGGEPIFPEPALRAGNSGRAPHAVALPDRWVAVGLRRVGVRLEPVFTRWGNTVPDAVNVGPSFERLAEISQSPDEPPIDAELRWLTEYDDALSIGMAITVRDADLSSGSLSGGLDLLLVFGVDWTLTPDQGAANFAALLQAHQYGDGIAFVPQGTPTNNTGTERSGFSSNEAPTAGDPLLTPALDRTTSAAGRMSDALGLPAGAVDLARLAGAGLSEQRTVSLLVDALWESTLGYYLDVLIDPFATDTLIGLARDHATEHLQPFGPYAAFRVGKQPYGLLPTIALSQFKPDRPSGIESGLQRLLTVLEWYWREGLADVPRMGRSGDPDDDLLQLLQQTAVAASARFRRVLDTETVSNTDGLKGLAAVQSNILRSLVLPMLASYAGPMFNAARILDLAIYPTDRPLAAPWVQPGALEPGAALARNYVAEIAQQTRAGTAGRADLHNRTRSTYALLETLLAHAALRELDRGSARLLDKYHLDVGLITELPNKASIHTGATIGIYQQPEETVPGKVFVQTPKQLAGAVVPALTGNATIADYVSAQIRLPLGPERPELHTLSAFLGHLDALAGVPAAEIDRALRAVLDCYSHRYDAWVTSLASRRMADVRARRAGGLHIGGYGWVENLRPDTRPDRSSDSLGYVHAPSLNHASTAALLRSGHLSHRGAEGAALNIDLSSRRVRNAMTVLEGVAQGQPLAALLGYRFERGLRDRDITLARFILPFRKLAPLRSTTPDAGSEPSESIAARDVVDGVALAERWRKGEDLIGPLTTTPPSTGERTLLEDALADLSDALDAVSDVLTAEAVYQTVQGNYERAGAALSALDRQTRPPDPQVVRTPRSGMMYTQRVVLLLQDSAMPAAWQNVPLDLRAQVEPRLNAWIATLLGDPTRFTLAAQLRHDGQEATTLTATLADLGLSPLTLALTCVSTHAQRPSELELRLAEHFAGMVAEPTPESELALLDEPPPDADEDAIGFGALRALLRMINTFIARRRALDSRDLFPPEGEPPPGFDLDELRGRLDNLVRPALGAAIADLDIALAAPDAPALRDALRTAAAIGTPDALPDTLLDDETAIAELVAQATGVLAALRRTEKQLTDRINGFEPPNPADATYNIRVADHLVACLRLVLGEAFPLLPLFSPTNAAELNASHVDQSALLDGDSFAPLTWLHQLATVRPDVDALVAPLTAADLLSSGPAAGDFSVVQLPHVAGQRWAGLTQPATPPLLAVVALGRFDATVPLAGLLVDGWSEIIPADKEMTGVTFHYDAPAARAPQAVLLAVTPDLSQAHWSYEAVFQTLLDTWELMQLRAVGPKEIRALGGGMLPAIYLPQDNSYQVPSVDLDRLVDAYRAVGVASVIGKIFHDE